MAKVYIPGETKEQRKERKRREKGLVPTPTPEPVVDIPPKENSKFNILCLKHGGKYSADYVNNLYNMVKRHCTLPFDFICLTENSDFLHPDIIVKDLPTYVQGWWCKPYMFSNDLQLDKTTLYIDLDVVISGSIDKLLTWSPGKWCTVRDFTRAMRPGWPKYNSSVIRFEPGQLDNVWQHFKNKQQEIQKRYFGDQDYLYEYTCRDNPAELYPESWIVSWKWEVRKSREFKPGGKRGDRHFKYIENVTPKIETSICVFHGDPNPHKCQDPWVVDNWK